jgi:hypothetical protein
MNSNQSARQSAVNSNEVNRQSTVSGGYGYGGAYGAYHAAPVAGAYAYGAAVAGTAAVVGAAAGAAAAQPAPVTVIQTLPCSSSAVMAGGAAYYQCNGTWYTPTYVGGSVAYAESAPPG